MLSGGGARGAYETGVIRYLREELDPALGAPARLDVLCGTSVGAITACVLAATMDTPATQGKTLEALWADLTFEKVYKVEGEDLWTVTRKMWRAATNEPLRPEGWRLYDLLHPEPLEMLVRTQPTWAKISWNLAAGKFSALSVSATEISSGHTIVFVQQRGDATPPTWAPLSAVDARSVVIGPEHALASSAIPMLFRSVQIGDEFFCDGSLRQNTPLSPALRLGAKKVLIVSLKHQGARPKRPLQAYPSTPMLMGKVLNALMLDHTDHDLERLRRTNAMLEAGVAAYGPDFVARLNETVVASRGHPYRIVKDLVLRPSRDIAQVASEHLRRATSTRAAVSLPVKLLHRVAQSQLLTEADLASYLLFDGEYAKALITMAMEDTHARRDELIRFFSEP